MWGYLRQLLKNPNTRPIFIKTLVFLGLFCVTFYGTYGMARSFMDVRKQKISKDRELEAINQRIDTIRSESAQYDDFQKEKVLREKLHMVRPGEDLILIVPEEKEIEE